ncbi:MAG: S-adenosylmethionine-binding protein [Proteobacteria bacterium]|nr:S-adenosylmethionine-binding protein [Pseudomonadota bacterium]
MKVQKQPTAQAEPSATNPGAKTKNQTTKKETTVNALQTIKKTTADAKVIHCGGKVYRIHPAADIFIAMDQATLAELTADIKAKGQYETIKVKEGVVVDGRARLMAANDAGIEPRFEELDVAEEAIADTVVSLNKHRKHLTASQLAMAAARHATFKKGDNQHSDKGGVSQGQAASAMKVSVDSLARGLRVHMNGVPELNAAVDKGLIDVTNASLVAMLPAEKQAEVVAKGAPAMQEAAKEVKVAKASEKQAAKLKEKAQVIAALRAKNKPLPVGGGKRYGLIYADVPWDHLGPLGAPYPTMTDEEIGAMPVEGMAEDDAVLFFWATASTLPNALEIIKKWGFTYKTHAVWTKGESGMGGYFRTNHEVLMLATRGKPPRVVDGTQPQSSFYEDRREHSRKPEKAYEMIQAMYPGLTKLEMFCRGKPRAGWDGWGNQCEGSIEMPPSAPTLAPTPVAANETAFKDAGDELLAAMGIAEVSPEPIIAKRA